MKYIDFDPVPFSANTQTNCIDMYFTLKLDKFNAPFGDHDRIILLTFDDNYVDQSINMIMSILQYHPNGIAFICLCPDITVENQQSLLALKCPLRLMCYDHTPLIPTRSWPACATFRLFAPWLLESKIHKVLYLDSDILCFGNIQPLLDAEPEYLALCGEAAGNILANQQRYITKYLPTEVYCNSGVCVINLDAFRQQFSFESFSTLLLQHQGNLCFPDQDFLNFFFRDKTVIMNSWAYNFQPYELWGSFLYRHAVRNCKLVHFAFIKPWSYKAELYLIQLYLSHSTYPPMIRKIKSIRVKSVLHSLIRFTRPLRHWLSGE